MTTSPDSALWLLEDSVQTSGMSRRQYAEWCLLLTQAQDKNYVPHTSDSLIRIAVDYFEEHGPNSRQMLSYYYMGRVSQDLQRAPAAADYYLKALEVGKTSDDYALLGRIHSNLGMLYTYQGTHEIALPHLKQAEFCFRQVSDTLFQSLSQRDIARSYNMLNQTDSAIFYYQQVLEYTNSYDEPFILSELGGLYIRKSELITAYRYAQEALNKIKGKEDFSPIYLVMGEVHKEMGNVDSARYYLQKTIDQSLSNVISKAGAYFHMYQLERENRQWEKYACFQEKYESLHDSIMEHTYTETMLKMQHLYNYQQIEKEAIQAKINQVRAERNSVYIIVLAICIIGSLTAHFSYLRARKKKKRKALSNSFQEFRDKLNTKDIEQLKNNILQIAKLSNEIKKEEKDSEFIWLEVSLLGQIRQFIEKRIKEEEEKTDHVRSSRLYNLFQKGNVKDITDKKKEELRALINEAYPRFDADICKLCPSITNDDLLLCYLIKIGLSGVRISNIFYISQQAVSMKRIRLAQRLFGDEKPLPKLDDFISSL